MSNDPASLQALVQDGVTELWKSAELPRIIIDREDIDLAIEVFRWVEVAGLGKSEVCLAAQMLETIRDNFLDGEVEDES